MVSYCLSCVVKQLASHLAGTGRLIREKKEAQKGGKRWAKTSRPPFVIAAATGCLQSRPEIRATSHQQVRAVHLTQTKIIHKPC